MKKTLLNISAAAFMSLTAINANASDNIGIDNNDDQPNISYSSSIFYQPTIEHITTDENMKTTSQLSPQNEHKIDILSSLPDEIKLHGLQQLSVKDIIKMAATNHSWQNMLNYSEISQAIALQRLYPTYNLHMSYLSHPIIKAALTGRAKLTIRKGSEVGGAGGLYAIKNNGEFFLRNTLRQPDIQNDPEFWAMRPDFEHKTLYLSTPIGQVSTNNASADGMIHAGTAHIDNTRKAFITTDQKTIEFLQTPDDIFSTKVDGMSGDGRTIIGQVKYPESKEFDRSFRWTRQHGMTILSKDSPKNWVSCVSYDGNLIGGSVQRERGKPFNPVIWLSDTKAFFIKDLLNLSYHPEAEGVDFHIVSGMSLNSKIIWGIGYIDTVKDSQVIWTFNCSEDQASN